MNERNIIMYLRKQTDVTDLKDNNLYKESNLEVLIRTLRLLTYKYSHRQNPSLNYVEIDADFVTSLTSLMPCNIVFHSCNDNYQENTKGKQ